MANKKPLKEIPILKQAVLGINEDIIKFHGQCPCGNILNTETTKSKANEVMIACGYCGKKITCTITASQGIIT